MKSFLIVSILLANVWFSSNVNHYSALSPLCDNSSEELKIDSIVVKNKNLVLYFINETITLVNYNTNSIEKVENINKYFKSNSNDRKLNIIPPIGIAFIHRDYTNERILTIINTRKYMHWNISFDNNTILGAGGNLLSNHLDYKAVIDMFNEDDKSGYVFIYNENLRLIKANKYEWNSLMASLTISHILYILRSRDNYTQIALTDEIQDISGTEPKLNGFGITSVVIFDNSFKVYANRYSCDVSLVINNYTNCSINNFTDEICEQTSTTPETTSDETNATIDSFTTVTEKVNTESPEKSMFWTYAVIALIVIAVLVAIILILMYFMRKSSNKSTKTKRKYVLKESKEQNPKETTNESKSELEIGTNVAKQESHSFVFSGRDPSKPIPVIPKASNQRSSSSLDILRPTDLKVKD